MKKRLSQQLRTATVSILLMFGAGFLAASAAEAQVVELKLQFFQASQQVGPRLVRALSPRVEKITEGRVKISVFDSGTLSKGPQMFDAVEKGVVDIGAWAFSFASAKNLPLLMLGSFPFVYRDAAGYIDAWKDDSLLALANDYISEAGYRHVAIGSTYYAGFYQMGFKDKEPKSPSDLKGLKVRSLGSIMPFFERNRVSAVSVDPPAVYEALQRGIVDGAIGVYANWVDWGWGEPATYLVDFNIAAVGIALLVNKDSMAKLRPSDRVAVESFLRWVSDALNEHYLKTDQTYRQIVSDHLMKIHTPSGKDLQEWNGMRKEVGDEIKRQWLEKIGEQGAKALRIIEKHNGELAYKKPASAK